MAKIIGLPKLSPTMEEGTLLEWTKKEGDSIDVDDLLAEVETDKATMEFRSFDKGILLKILVPEGETLAPDTPVAIIGKAGEDITSLIEQAQVGQPASDASGQGAKPQNGAGATSAAVAAPAAATPPASPATGTTSTETAPGGRVLSSPLVRRIAREKGLDLRQVQGSGPRGRIIKRDLEGQTIAAPAALPASAFGVRQPPRTVKASATRKTIARRLTESKQQVPHFYLSLDVDAEPIWNARKSMNAALAKQDEKVSVNDLILKACAVGLRRVPEVNASWNTDEIVYHQVVDISVAVAIPDGLITPIVRDADRKSVLEISREVKELARRARDKKLGLDEITGGTFSVSNLGMFGIDEFSAVINPPEGAILAVGQVTDQPVVKGGAIVPGKRMKLTLSCDHRVVDGAVGAKYCAVLRELLESPLNMLI